MIGYNRTEPSHERQLRKLPALNMDECTRKLSSCTALASKGLEEPAADGNEEE